MNQSNPESTEPCSDVTKVSGMLKNLEMRTREEDKKSFIHSFYKLVQTRRRQRKMKYNEVPDTGIKEEPRPQTLVLLENCNGEPPSNASDSLKRAMSIPKATKPTKDHDHSYSARTSAGCGLSFERDKCTTNLCFCLGVDCAYEAAHLFDLFKHDFIAFLCAREQLLPSSYREAQQGDIQRMLDDSKKLREKASDLHTKAHEIEHGITDTYFNDVPEYQDTAQNIVYTVEEIPAGDLSSTANTVIDSVGNAVDSVVNVAHVGGDEDEKKIPAAKLPVYPPFDTTLIKYESEDVSSMSRKFRYFGLEYPMDVEVVYRNQRRSDLSKNKKRKMNIASRKAIGYLVERNLIKFGEFNSQYFVNVHCCTLDLTCNGMAHLQRRDGVDLKPPLIEFSGIEDHDAIEPENIDETYVWRISFFKPQADIFIPTGLMIEIASKSGEPYVNCPFFLDPKGDSAIVREWKNNLMNPEVEGMDSQERQEMRRKRKERREERQANAKRANTNSRWEGADDV